jgi:hypothetical protein
MITLWSVKQQNVDVILSVWFVTNGQTQLRDKGDRVPGNKWHEDWLARGPVRRRREKADIQGINLSVWGR